MSLGLIAGLFVVGTALRLRLRYSAVEQATTWGCGYVTPTPRMQYTASSFAQMLVGLFAWVLRPRTQQAREPAAVPARRQIFTATFPTQCSTRQCCPCSDPGHGSCPGFGSLQQGSVQTYLLYIFVALIALLLWR